jgi:hypothetical protein
LLAFNKMFKGICLFRRILANAPRKGARRVVPLCVEF